jgi:hypothetical protein
VAAGLHALLELPPDADEDGVVARAAEHDQSSATRHPRATPTATLAPLYATLTET